MILLPGLSHDRLLLFSQRRKAREDAKNHSIRRPLRPLRLCERNGSLILTITDAHHTISPCLAHQPAASESPQRGVDDRYHRGSSR